MEKISYPSIPHYVRCFTEPSERLGSTYVPGHGTYIRLWAPEAEVVTFEQVGREKIFLDGKEGYFTAFIPDLKPGDCYWYHLHDLKRIADPVSHLLPTGIGGPTAVKSPSFVWSDEGWKGVDLKDAIIYELHAGTYSETHDFEGIIRDLPRLKELGITMIELMPVSQFSGDRNWGYDGAFFHAVQNTYGGPDKLKELVNACHAHGIAIILDVVYNHVGPEGSVLLLCGPYHTEKYQSAWGAGINFDDKHSNHVRRFFLQSAWDWLIEFHFDGLRLDAIHMATDVSPLKFFQELTLLAQEAEKIRKCPLTIIAETDKNDPTVVWPVEENGLGMHAHWADDFQHCLYATLTGEKQGYYQEYGGLEQLAQIYQQGVLFQGEYSSYRNRHHGRPYTKIDKQSIIVESQNHDQVGNRPHGERLITLTNFEKAKLTAACVLLSPFTPLLFMGEEYACRQPFYYFTSYYDAELVKAVIEGRKKEWEDFGTDDDMPNSNDHDVFDKSVLRQKSTDQSAEASVMFAFYKDLIKLAKYLKKHEFVTAEKQDEKIILVYKDTCSVCKVKLDFSQVKHSGEEADVDGFLRNGPTNSSLNFGCVVIERQNLLQKTA